MQTLIDTCGETPIYNCSVVRDIGLILRTMSAGEVVLVCDNNTYRNCYPLIKKVLPPHHIVKLQAGEKHKQYASAQKVWDKLIHQKAGKDALLIALGGGVVCDVTGFAASIYKRGIPVVYIPTTLMAQADAAIGGKNGIDMHNIKNALGTFYHPEAVILHPPFLKTLSEREYHNGLAEIIKIGAVSHPDLFYKLVDKNTVPNNLIMEAIKAKCAIVNEDIHDDYLRHILNFGHTLGHAIESVFMNTRQPLLHGEAIALGMIGEAYLSYSLRQMPIEELDDILFVLNKWKLIRPVKLEENKKQIVSLCLQDKKNIKGSIHCVLLQTLGSPIIDIPISAIEILQAIIYTDNYISSL